MMIPDSAILSFGLSDTVPLAQPGTIAQQQAVSADSASRKLQLL